MEGKIFFVIVGIIILLYLTTQVESFHGYRGYGYRYNPYPGYNNWSPYYRGWCPWWNTTCQKVRNWGPGGRYWW